VPLRLRNGGVGLKNGLQYLHRSFVCIPAGLRFALLLFLTILAFQIPYLWFNHRQTTRIVDMQYRIALLHQLKSAQMALKHEMRRFQRHLEDYCIWGDAASAIKRKDTAWLASNIWDWVSTHLGYESVVVWDSKGMLLGYSGWHPDTILRTQRTLYERARQGIGDVKLMQHKGRLLMVAWGPVRDDELTNVVYGVICFVEEVDERIQLALLGAGRGRLVPHPPSKSHEAVPLRSPQFSEHSGHAVSVSLPIFSTEGWPIASIVSSIDPSQSLATRQSLLYTRYGSWVISAFLTLGASLMMILFVRRHLSSFLHVVGRLAHGDWTARINYPARDEFGYLAKVFNRMADNLQQSFEHQERQRQEILARTAELESLHRQLLALNEMLRAKNEQLKQAARTDGLTGLLNHAAFQSALHVEVQRADRLNQPLSLIMLDVDHFKQLNDTYGHPAGDEVLRQVAAVLRHHARPYDVLARYGGEEFVVLLPGTTLESALSVAERLRRAIEQIESSYAPISASFGVAEHQPGAAPANLIYNADLALYTAKRSGRNRVCAYQKHTA